MMTIQGGKTASKIVVPKTTTRDVDYETFVYVDKPPKFTYVVQPGDTIAVVAHHVYGVNNRKTRDSLRKQGFAPGVTVTNTP